MHNTIVIDIKENAVTVIGEMGIPERCDSARSICNLCSRKFLHCDGDVLKRLPAKLRNCFDVDPEYAQGDVYLSKTWSRAINNQVSVIF